MVWVVCVGELTTATTPPAAVVGAGRLVLGYKLLAGAKGTTASVA